MLAGTPPLRSSSRSEGAAEAAQGGTAPDSLERDRTRSRSSSRRESAEAMLAADASGSGRWGHRAQLLSMQSMHALSCPINMYLPSVPIMPDLP